MPDEAFLRALLNSPTVDEELQVIAYKLLNVDGYSPTQDEIVALAGAKLAGLPHSRSAPPSRRSGPQGIP